MYKLITLFLFGIFLVYGFTIYAQDFDYEQEWGTYFGDRNMQIGDNAIDHDGNIYLVGSVTEFSVFTATDGSHQTNYGGGETDGFIVKFSPQGNVLWSTFLGGNNTDYITGITIDKNDNLYVLGMTSSENNISTSNSFQTTIEGVTDYFVVRFSSDGVRDWGTYISNGTVGDTIPLTGVSVDITSVGNSIVTDDSFIYFNTTTTSLDMATQGVFQDTIGQSQNDLISKFSFDGQRVWSTYYGINRSNIYSIAVDDNALYIAGQTQDLPPHGSYNTYFGTPDSYQETPYNAAGTPDVFLSKLNKEGNRIWSTYFGNSSQDFIGKNALLADNDFIYLTGLNPFKTDITTSDCYQDSTTNDMTSYLVKFTAEGDKQWATFIGLNPEQEYNTDGSPMGWKYYSMLSKDTLGNIYMGGSTLYRDNISTTDAFQFVKEDVHRDLYIAVFNPIGEKLYGSYFGGESRETSAHPLVYKNNLYLSGYTESQTGIATSYAFQSDINNQGYYVHGVPFLAKFTIPIESDSTNSLIELGNNQKNGLVIYPNPNNGTFMISSKEEIEGFSVFSIQGQLIRNQNIDVPLTEIEVSDLQAGIYFVKMKLGYNRIISLKIIVN